MVNNMPSVHRGIGYAVRCLGNSEWQWEIHPPVEAARDPVLTLSMADRMGGILAARLPSRELAGTGPSSLGPAKGTCGLASIPTKKAPRVSIIAHPRQWRDKANRLE